MRTVILYCTILFLLFSTNILAQKNKREIYSGKWYASGINYEDFKTLDTIMLTRNFNDSVYTQLLFEDDSVVNFTYHHINNYHKNNLNKNKYLEDVLSVGSEPFWSLSKTKDTINLKYNNGTQPFFIISSNETLLKLKKLKFKATPKNRNYTLYYFSNSIVDENIINKDTLICSTEGSSSLPNIKLQNDKKFVVSYDIDLDTITEKKPDGVYVTKLVDKSKHIYGIWSSSDISKYIQLQFNSNLKNDYVVHKLDDKIVLIKK